jgi:hypothetical protein
MRIREAQKHGSGSPNTGREAPKTGGLRLKTEDGPECEHAVGEHVRRGGDGGELGQLRGRVVQLGVALRGQAVVILRALPAGQSAAPGAPR